MNRNLITALILTFSFLFARADEGMWLPYLLKQLNEKDMQAKGLRLSADDIYNVNQSSLKDAVVLFGTGCTGEFVSEQGLLLTNHHCGYPQIQAHSSLEKDYLQHGFWAMNREEELPNQTLKATLLVYMDDVTKDVLKDVSDTMTLKERNAKIKENIKLVIEKAIEGTHYKAIIKPIFNENQYLLFVNEVFEDVRLVGAPPSNIGKFGGDTDNWMWPRHGGDFAVFRVYVGKDGKPAPYSADNVPYTPKKHIPISLKGIEADDFTFVFGYPGTTQQFLTSWAVDLIQNQRNPIAIELRTKRLDIIKKHMDSDPLTRIQYSAKAANISNGWKKWIGENKGLKRLNTIETKKELETEFLNWIAKDEMRQQQYGHILPQYEQLYERIGTLSKENLYFNEAFNAVEIARFTRNVNWIYRTPDYEAADDKFKFLVEQQTKIINQFFKDYNPTIDKEVFILLMKTYYDNVHRENLHMKNRNLLEQHKCIKKNVGNWDGHAYAADDSRVRTRENRVWYTYNMESLANQIYSKSIFIQKDNLIKILEERIKKTRIAWEKDTSIDILEENNRNMQVFWKNDILYQFIATVYLLNEGLASKLRGLEAEIKQLDRLWTKALMEMQPNKTFYPDANLTLRVTYGKIDGYNPRDGVSYKHYTTIEGIMEKEDPDIYDYFVEPKLKTLYANKDYGRYAMKNGEMPIAFIATNHTTGGNSGSPILNADGHLVGLNFDRCWEGTMSDIHYDPDQCRNISIDIRYCLFIIDKFAGAKHLIEEMTVVE